MLKGGQIEFSQETWFRLAVVHEREEAVLRLSHSDFLADDYYALLDIITPTPQRYSKAEFSRSTD